MTQPRPGYFTTTDPRFIGPSSVDRLRDQAQLGNQDIDDALEVVRNNLFTKLLNGFTSVGNAIGNGIQTVVLAITGVVGGGLNTLETWFKQLLQAGQGIPILSPIASGLYDFFFHQSAVANTASGAASQASSIFSQLVGGWSGTVPPTAGDVAQTMSEIKTATIGNKTVTRLTGSGNFIVPDCKFLTVNGFNGGGGGQGAPSNAAGVPGGNGGHRSKRFTPPDLGGVGAVIPYVTGNAGAGGQGGGQGGGVGGISTFGPVEDPFVKVASAVGVMASPGGWTPTSSVGGSGGYGGVAGFETGGAGGAGVYGSGGAGGTRGQRGQDGSSPPITDAPAGGSGGGGGGGNSGIFSPGAAGGAGGRSAGGGGGGHANNSSPLGGGGNGGPGFFDIVTE